jgi:hypothetical protein
MYLALFAAISTHTYLGAVLYKKFTPKVPILYLFLITDVSFTNIYKLNQIQSKYVRAILV